MIFKLDTWQGKTWFLVSMTCVHTVCMYTYVCTYVCMYVYLLSQATYAIASFIIFKPGACRPEAGTRLVSLVQTSVTSLCICVCVCLPPRL